MKEELKYNLYNYLKTNSKKQFSLSILLLILCSFLLFFLIKIKIYDVEIINAQTSCELENCTIKFYQNNLIKKEYNFAKIKNKKYQITNISFAEPMIDNTNTILQEVNVNLKNYQGNQNEIVEIKLYKNKERMIKKIFKIMVER